MQVRAQGTPRGGFPCVASQCPSSTSPDLIEQNHTAGPPSPHEEGYALILLDPRELWFQQGNAYRLFIITTAETALALLRSVCKPLPTHNLLHPRSTVCCAQLSHVAPCHVGPRHTVVPCRMPHRATCGPWVFLMHPTQGQRAAS